MSCHLFRRSNIRADWLAFICYFPCRAVQHADGSFFYPFQMFLWDMKRKGRAVSFIPTVVVEPTWEGAVHNTGLERTKPRVLCQDKWPAGSYATRVASGRGFLLLILLCSIPTPSTLSTCIKIMVHRDTWQAWFFVTWSVLSHEAPWEETFEVVLSPPLLFRHSGTFFFFLVW